MVSRGGMRAAGGTNKAAEMLGPASHVCHSANQRWVWASISLYYISLLSGI